MSVITSSLGSKWYQTIFRFPNRANEKCPVSYHAVVLIFRLHIFVNPTALGEKQIAQFSSDLWRGYDIFDNNLLEFINITETDFDLLVYSAKSSVTTLEIFYAASARY